MEALDSQTLARLKPLKNLFASSNVELFLVSFPSGSGEAWGKVQPSISRGALMDLAQATAGTTMLLNEYGGHSEDLVRHLLGSLRTLYTFGFESEDSTKRPSRLVIQCTRAGSKVRSHPNVPIEP